MDSKSIFFYGHLFTTLWIFSFLFFPTLSIVGQMLALVLLLSDRSREWADPSLPCPAREEDNDPLSELQECQLKRQEFLCQLTACGSLSPAGNSGRSNRKENKVTKWCYEHGRFSSAVHLQRTTHVILLREEII